MDTNGVRVRSQLRQAARVAGAGKLVAAADLYREIIAEAPNSKAAWLGLAQVSNDFAEKKAAYEHVLTLDPQASTAAVALANLKGEPIPEWAALAEAEKAAAEAEAEETAVAPEPTPAPAVTHEHDHDPLEQEFDLVCYRHPDRETSLRCYKCSKPICIECTHKTPVGYLCPDCYREAEDAFFNNKLTDYIIAPLVALPLSLLAGFVLTFLGGGFFFWIIIFFVGGAVGSFIGRVTKRAIGKRRGRYIPLIVAACIVIGVGVFALPALLLGSFGALIGPGIFLFISLPAAYYWAR